jgi:NAD(P)-dependent dehydrogenase (short-subunit alcohol dehydrogenase family)
MLLSRTSVHRCGVRADYVSCDLSKVPEIDELWKEVTRLYPNGIDILINNAGNCMLYFTITGYLWSSSYMSARQFLVFQPTEFRAERAVWKIASRCMITFNFTHLASQIINVA